ncbi:hypothetical protein BCR39DRAFT_588340 [Naematelia encephala]|uniref:Uncharacterized protein n=1 Tax=Naematelia encephala TaxID=71784 RepID=A0A1Y2B3J4_9TREE|nr:hypothetical protein BCR39DRAFT_588340 [Naematelia encephala]
MTSSHGSRHLASSSGSSCPSTRDISGPQANGRDTSNICRHQLQDNLLGGNLGHQGADFDANTGHHYTPQPHSHIPDSSEDVSNWLSQSGQKTSNGDWPITNQLNQLFVSNHHQDTSHFDGNVTHPGDPFSSHQDQDQVSSWLKSCPCLGSPSPGLSSRLNNDFDGRPASYPTDTFQTNSLPHRESPPSSTIILNDSTAQGSQSDPLSLSNIAGQGDCLPPDIDMDILDPLSSFIDLTGSYRYFSDRWPIKFSMSQYYQKNQPFGDDANQKDNNGDVSHPHSDTSFFQRTQHAISLSEVPVASHDLTNPIQTAEKFHSNLSPASNMLSKDAGNGSGSALALTGSQSDKTQVTSGSRSLNSTQVVPRKRKLEQERTKHGGDDGARSSKSCQILPKDVSSSPSQTGASRPFVLSTPEGTIFSMYCINFNRTYEEFLSVTACDSCGEPNKYPPKLYHGRTIKYRQVIRAYCCGRYQCYVDCRTTAMITSGLSFAKAGARVHAACGALSSWTCGETTHPHKRLKGKDGTRSMPHPTSQNPLWSCSMICLEAQMRAAGLTLIFEGPSMEGSTSAPEASSKRARRDPT